MISLREELSGMHPLVTDPERDKVSLSLPVVPVWEEVKVEDIKKYIRRKKELYYEKRLSY